jgi:hypothetical protein
LLLIQVSAMLDLFFWVESNAWFVGSTRSIIVLFLSISDPVVTCSILYQWQPIEKAT